MIVDLNEALRGLNRQNDIVGYGDEYSKSRPTSTRNHYVRIKTIPVEGGADVVIEGLHNLIFSDGEMQKVLHLREDYGPRIGERVMCNGKLIKVKQKRWGGGGRLEVLDEDTQTWMIWS